VKGDGAERNADDSNVEKMEGSRCHTYWKGERTSGRYEREREEGERVKRER